MSLQPFDRQVFAADGTWYRRPGTRAVRVQLLGGGSGGGGGARAAVAANRIGGGAGAAGVYLDAWYSAADLATTVAVTIGTGGAGGAAATGDTAPGATGTTGGVSRFGSLLVTAPAWQAAGGGQLAAVAAAGLGQLGNTPLYPGQGAASFNSIAQGSQQATNNQPGGGSPGGNVSSANATITPNNGINNVAMNDPNVQIAGAFGLPPTPVASPKQLADVAYIIPWYSGAGGGGSTGGAGGSTGGNGGTAQGYGAGGGGGGASTNGFPAGTGGAGAPGICIVTSFR